MAQFRTGTTAHHDVRAAPTGAARRVLRGRIVTMDAAGTVLEDGHLAIEGNRIVHLGPVRQPLPPGFADVPVVATAGTIYPGLIELHNHLAYNAIPLWRVPGRFPNRSVWRAHEHYLRAVARPATLLTHDPLSETARSVVRFVECRSLLGGVTTSQGLSVTSMDPATQRAYRGLIRNVELPDDPSWPTAEDRINDFASTMEAGTVYGPLLNDRKRPFIMHLSEGVDDDARRVFDYLKQPDGKWLIGSNFVGIHGTGLDATRLRALAAGAGLVWSPLSNYLLYGATADVVAAKLAGVPLALGSDWAPSGTKNLLGELKVAKAVSQRHGHVFSDIELVRMVTSAPAKMIGWDRHIGSLASGRLADLLVLDGTSGDPFAQLIAADEGDIVAVVIDGVPRLGRAGLIEPRSAGVERIHVANQDMVLDLLDDPGHPLAGTTLDAAIGTLSHALEHLPEMAAQFADQHKLLGYASTFVRLDMDEPMARSLVSGRTRIAPDDVDRLHLDPITAVDDRTFHARLAENPNLPEWLRASLFC